MSVNRIGGEFDAGRRSVARNVSGDSNEFLELLQEHIGSELNESVSLGNELQNVQGVGSVRESFPIHSLSVDPQTFLNKDQILDVNTKINDALSRLL